MPQQPTPEQYEYLRRLAFRSAASSPLSIYLSIHGEGSASRDQQAEILRDVRKVFTALKAQGWVQERPVDHKGHRMSYYRITGKGLTLVADTEEQRRKERKKRKR